MQMLRKTIRTGAVLAAVLLSCSAWAVKVSPSSLSLAPGASQTVKVSSVSGSLSVYASKGGVVYVSRLEDDKYRIEGVAAGTVVLEFKDRKSTAQVNVTVAGAGAGADAAVQTTGSLNGRLLASNCFQCHGTNGTGGFDRLAGKSASKIYGELKEFVSGKEDPDGIMAAHAKGFSDAQLRAIAEYFSTVR